MIYFRIPCAPINRITRLVLAFSVTALSFSVPTEAPAGIIGRDDRTESSRMPDHLVKLGRRVGQLVTTTPTGKGKNNVTTCTGSLINKKFIITAAHCAYTADGRAHRNLFFFPGRKFHDHAPYNKYRVKTVYHPKNYAPGSTSPRNDIAVMELRQSETRGKYPGDVVGTLGFWGKPTFPLGSATTIGYPSKRKGVQVFEQDCDVWLPEPQSNAMWSDCDVSEGQSGSPVLFYSDKYDLYAVHGVLTGSGESRNAGARLSNERMKIMKSIFDGSFGTSAYRAKGYEEAWLSRDMPKANRVHVHIRNDCRRTKLFVARSYKNASDEWETTGHVEVKPDTEMNLFESRNGIYYLSVRTEDKRLLTRKDTRKPLQNYRFDETFQKFKVTVWGDNTHSFDC